MWFNYIPNQSSPNILFFSVKNPKSSIKAQKRGWIFSDNAHSKIIDSKENELKEEPPSRRNFVMSTFNGWKMTLLPIWQIGLWERELIEFQYKKTLETFFILNERVFLDPSSCPSLMSFYDWSYLCLAFFWRFCSTLYAAELLPDLPACMHEVSFLIKIIGPTFQEIKERQDFDQIFIMSLKTKSFHPRSTKIS